CRGGARRRCGNRDEPRCARTRRRRVLVRLRFHPPAHDARGQRPRLVRGVAPARAANSRLDGMRFPRLAMFAVGVLLLAACGGPLTKEADQTRVSTPPTPARRPAVTPRRGPSEATVKSDLRN